jgi:hypothetical protein
LAALRSPCEALLQIPSTLLFRLAEISGSFSITDLHTASASAWLTELLGVEAGVELVAGVVALTDDVEVVLADAVLLVAGVLVEVELELELELLPQPASSAPVSSARSRSGNRVAIIGPPWDRKNAQGLRAASVAATLSESQSLIQCADATARAGILS